MKAMNKWLVILVGGLLASPAYAIPLTVDEIIRSRLRLMAPVSF